MTINDRIIATIRTGVPALVGLILAQLIALIPAVQDIIGWADANLGVILGGVPVATVLATVATAAVIAGYYWAVRWVGVRYPAVEKWLLGSKLTPVYSADGTPLVTSLPEGDSPKHLA